MNGIDFKPYGVLRDFYQGAGYSKRRHKWESPPDEYRHLIQDLAKPASLVVDLTVGSGSPAVGCAMAGSGRRFAGGDLDPENCKVARARVAEYLRAQKEG